MAAQKPRFVQGDVIILHVRQSRAASAAVRNRAVALLTNRLTTHVKTDKTMRIRPHLPQGAQQHRLQAQKDAPLLVRHRPAAANVRAPQVRAARRPLLLLRRRRLPALLRLLLRPEPGHGVASGRCCPSRRRGRLPPNGRCRGRRRGTVQAAAGRRKEVPAVGGQQRQRALLVQLQRALGRLGDAQRKLQGTDVRSRR